MMQWDDALADSLAAVNLFLDRSRDRRKADDRDVLATSARVGPPNEASTWWRMRCVGSGRCRASAAALRVSITLAPTMPPAVQYFEVSKAPATPQAPRGICPAP